MQRATTAVKRPADTSPIRSTEPGPLGRLTGSEAGELADYLVRPDVITLDRLDAFWLAHTEYARRAAIALAGNDLASALRLARISTHALAQHNRYT